MRVAFCIFKFFPHGGIPRDLMKIARECRSRGHRVRIYAGRWEAERPAEIEVIEIPATGVSGHRRYARFAAGALDHLQRHPVDLVVGMNKMPGLDVYYAGDSCYAEKASRQRNRLYRLLPRYRQFVRLERAVFSAHAATEILTLSDAQIRDFRRHYATPLERFHPLPPGIDADRRAPPDREAQRRTFRSEFGIADHEHLLLFLGSGFIKKGLDRVLRGVSTLPADLGARTRLFVVGHDHARPFRRMARRLGIGDRVTFFTGRDDVPRFLFGADALLLPAYDENAGMVIIEAMIAGLPALVTGNCGYAHHLQEAEAGLVTPEPFDQRRFNDQLVELIISPERHRWRANGLAKGQDPNLFRLAEATVNHLETFADRRRSAVGSAVTRGATADVPAGCSKGRWM